MTSQVFHLVMLVAVGAMGFVSWHGYRYEPWERKTALKWSAAAAGWFGYLVWAGAPEFLEGTFVETGLLVLGVVAAINARRLLLGIEFAFARHWAASPILSALRSGAAIDAATMTSLLDDRPVFFIPGLRYRLHRLRAAQAQALQDKVTADALLVEAIVRRERARQEAEILRARRMAGPDAWREAAGARVGRHR